MRLTYMSGFWILNKHVIDYPTPINFNYFWGFGSLAGACLGFQILSGILLGMHYTPHVSLAFYSVEHVMRDVQNGWLLRYIHANGASMFFFVVYTHIGRGLYFGSYLRPTRIVWVSGVVIFFLMMATAFMGYVLPWGQMSFWGATVITNLFTAIPVVGSYIVLWLWGGFAVDNPTLNRFFSLHYLLPFIIAGVALLHIVVLHINGSNNPLGIVQYQDVKGFYPYFYVKDLFGFLVFIALFGFIVGFYPNVLGHSDNFIEANPLITPTHIVPEWYFLPFYAILRSVPDKLGGVLLMGLSILVLLFSPLIMSNKSYKFRPLSQIFYWIFVVDVVLLWWLGSQSIEQPFILLAQITTFYYFFWFFVLRTFLAFFESFPWANKICFS